jgi:hypothetical protein
LYFHSGLLLRPFSILRFQQTWQEICLLLSDNPETACSEAVIINRPISKSINKSLAKAMLEGTSGSGVGSFSYDFVDSVVRAFGTEAAVYMGGPDMQEEPALLIHGISDLSGAFEVAPGTGIYRGGWEAAVDGVLQGKYQPLDFRFFLGRQSYDPARNPRRGVVLQKVQDGKYQPVACARSLALKQCLGLPKPLWHEGTILILYLNSTRARQTAFPLPYFVMLTSNLLL